VGVGDRILQRVPARPDRRRPRDERPRLCRPSGADPADGLVSLDPPLVAVRGPGLEWPLLGSRDAGDAVLPAGFGRGLDRGTGLLLLAPGARRRRTRAAAARRPAGPG